MQTTHPWPALLDRARVDGAAPMVTYYDLASGERMELSTASLVNAAAKAAGVLRDDLDVQPGDHVGLYLGLHWQVPVWFAAIAAVGGVVVVDAADPAAATCVVDIVDPAAPLGSAPEAIAAALAPFGLPGREPLPDIGRPLTEQATAARLQPDVFTPMQPPGSDDALLIDGAHRRSAGAVMDDALTLAEAVGVRGGGRLLLTQGADIVSAAVIPLAVQAAVVLVAGSPTAADLDRIRAQEHITAG